ncbi:hypothetical protein B9Z55_014782 [Caenorhabditis nigoni]|nr:hypothetical protein B9Z55_014782 [Caenorhabditis nigoni]
MMIKRRETKNQEKNHEDVDTVLSLYWEKKEEKLIGTDNKLMKKLKRRLSAAFRPGSNNNVSITSSGGSYYDSDCGYGSCHSGIFGHGHQSFSSIAICFHNRLLIAEKKMEKSFRQINLNPSHLKCFKKEVFPVSEARNNIVIGYGMMSAPLHGRTWTLSESMSHLSDKNGAIMEECVVDPTALLRVSRGGTAGRRYDTNVNYINGMHVPPPRTHSLYYPRGYNNSSRNSYYGSNACKYFPSF